MAVQEVRELAEATPEGAVRLEIFYFDDAGNPADWPGPATRYHAHHLNADGDRVLTEHGLLTANRTAR